MRSGETLKVWEEGAKARLDDVGIGANPYSPMNRQAALDAAKKAGKGAPITKRIAVPLHVRVPEAQEWADGWRAADARLREQILDRLIAGKA